MRILFITQVVLDRPHGGARHVQAVARELEKLGHAVTLIAAGRARDPEGVRRVRPPSGLRPGLRLESALAALAVREVKRDRPDVAYVRISATSSFVPLALAALGVPIVLELNGRILDELAKLGRGPSAIALVRTSLRRVVSSARALVAVEPRIGRHAEDALGAKHVEVIENGADLSAATPGDRLEAKRALGLDPNERYVAFTGTLVPELRLDLLFEAHRRLDRFALLVAGDGPQAERVRAAVEGARAAGRRPIVTLGPVPHASAVLAIRAAEVCVNARDGDLGMKCLEYAAIGRRLVTFRVEGAERLLQLYPGLQAVHLVGERTASALGDALGAALDAESRLGALPATAIEAARQTLGWDHTARRIAAVLERHRCG